MFQILRLLRLLLLRFVGSTSNVHVTCIMHDVLEGSGRLHGTMPCDVMHALFPAVRVAQQGRKGCTCARLR
jgi:hypothetical protein